MADCIQKVWELALACGHRVVVHPGPEGAFVVGTAAGCPTCDGILEPDRTDGADDAQ